MENWKNDRIGSCERGENPTFMVKMKSGFVVIGDHQFLPGYCLLLGFPKASSLNELSLKARMQYLIDMTLIGDAIIKVCNPLRINYSTLMNLDNYPKIRANVALHFFNCKIPFINSQIFT